jgi:copper chaperone CopZ
MSFLPDFLSYHTKVMTSKMTDSGAILSEKDKSSSNLLALKMTSVGCSACLVAVSAILKASVGVEHFDASIEQGKLYITYSKETNEERILQSLEDAGFPMEPMPRNHPKGKQL